MTSSDAQLCGLPLGNLPQQTLHAHILRSKVCDLAPQLRQLPLHVLPRGNEVQRSKQTCAALAASNMPHLFRH